MKKGKLVKILMGMAFCFLCLTGKKEVVSADMIYFPEDEFVEEHIAECAKQWDLFSGRQYEVIAGSEEIYQSPESKEPKEVVSKGAVIEIYFTYEDKETSIQWGCIAPAEWIPMENLKLIYDNTEFKKDHFKEIATHHGEIHQYEITLPLNFYHYPGSEKVVMELEEGDFDDSKPLNQWLAPKEIYEDENGKLWVYISTYNWGRKRGWICLSDMPKSIAQDYNTDGAVDLKDAKMVLCKALCIVDDGIKKATDLVERKVTLADAQKILRIVLKIFE